VGDRVVALAPAAGGEVVTSETATVVALDTPAGALVVRTEEGGALHRLEAAEIAADRLDHAYALTVHRAQGSTVARAHALEDGGGRELAYVKMSRARERSTVYVVATDMDQAREDLVREWSAERRPAWVIDSGTPLTDPAAVEVSARVAPPMRAALRRGRLIAERAAIAAVIPPDPRAEIRSVETELARVHHRRGALGAGADPYHQGPIGHALWEHRQAEMNLGRLQRELERPDASRRDRRRTRAALEGWRERHRVTARELDSLLTPEAARLDAEETRLTGRLSGLREQESTYRDWIIRHPEAARRLDHLSRQIEALDTGLPRGRGVPERAVGLEWPGLRPPVVAHDLGLDLGL